ncbi:MAG: glycosyltransferase family 2 protein [Verrucomicrobia bacterium]|nr:MAG: glycosyltransferase family 2 protein [Verrucomicrobiota bacterium]
MSQSGHKHPELDIVIPVYNEGENIVRVLDSFRRHVRTPCRVLICYDKDTDNTLPVVRAYPQDVFTIQPVKNRGRGALGAVLTGFEDSTASAVLMYPADDDYNAVQVDPMMQEFRAGCEIVVASRFIPGGCMKGCPWLKATLVRCSAFALYHLARLPTHDPSNGLRIFSRRVLDTISIESTVGFAYSIELLVKAHRLGWRIGEVPAGWFERREGKSRFQVLKWIPQYLRWFFYAFATTYFFRGPKTVRLKQIPSGVPARSA